MIKRKYKVLFYSIFAVVVLLLAFLLSIDARAYALDPETPYFEELTITRTNQTCDATGCSIRLNLNASSYLSNDRFLVVNSVELDNADAYTLFGNQTVEYRVVTYNGWLSENVYTLDNGLNSFYKILDKTDFTNGYITLAIIEDNTNFTCGTAMTNFLNGFKIYYAQGNSDLYDNDDIRILYYLSLGYYVNISDVGESYNNGYDVGYMNGHNDGYFSGSLFATEERDSYWNSYIETLDIYTDINEDGYDDPSWNAGRTYGQGENIEDSLNIFGVIGMLWAPIEAILGIALIGSITIGSIVAIPLVFGIIAFIVGIAKGGKK